MEQDLEFGTNAFVGYHTMWDGIHGTRIALEFRSVIYRQGEILNGSFISWWYLEAISSRQGMHAHAKPRNATLIIKKLPNLHLTQSTFLAVSPACSTRSGIPRRRRKEPA